MRSNVETPSSVPNGVDCEWPNSTPSRVAVEELVSCTRKKNVSSGVHCMGTYVTPKVGHLRVPWPCWIELRSKNERLSNQERKARRRTVRTLALESRPLFRYSVLHTIPTLHSRLPNLFLFQNEGLICMHVVIVAEEVFQATQLPLMDYLQKSE